MYTAFNKMRLVMTATMLSTFTEHKDHFNVQTDSTDYQMGACIMQDDHPIAYYSKKVNNAQKNFTTTGKKLSIPCTLEEFRSMLLGAKIHMFTDHKN